MTDEWFWRDYREYTAGAPEQVMAARICDERTAATPLDQWYFYQDTWAFRRIAEERPVWHLDVGSTALLVGVLSQVVPVTSLDVRPLPVQLPGLTCLAGTVTALPFEDDSVPSVSSLSVVEHIGLGRYGDEVDPRGAEKACGELQRVLEPGGRLYLSVPIADEPMTLFNMHRLLATGQVAGWLDRCRLDGQLEIQGEALTVWCSEWTKES